jgi:hypothetical protein
MYPRLTRASAETCRRVRPWRIRCRLSTPPSR